MLTRPHADFGWLPLRKIEFDYNGAHAMASAVILSGERLLTCRHVLPPSYFAMIEIENEQFQLNCVLIMNIKIDGQPRPHRIAAAGAGGSPSDDWVILEPAVRNDGAFGSDIRVETIVRTARLGDAVFVAGYPGSLDGELLFVSGRVMQMRSNGQIVIGIETEGSMINVGAGLVGLSGGAVVRERSAGGYEVIAMLSAVEERKFLGMTVSSRLIAIPIPSGIVETCLER